MVGLLLTAHGSQGETLKTEKSTFRGADEEGDRSIDVMTKKEISATKKTKTVHYFKHKTFDFERAFTFRTASVLTGHVLLCCAHRLHGKILDFSSAELQRSPQ